MKPVKLNPLSILGGFVTGARAPFGALCTRSADGVAKPTATGASVFDYLGLAIEDMVERTVDGFYSLYDPLPLLSAGTGRAWLLGGETINGGNFLKVPATLGAGTEGIGVLIPEGTPAAKTLNSVAKCIGDDVGDADYDQTIDSIAAKVLTFAGAEIMAKLDLVKGDYVVIASGQAAEVNRIDDPLVSTTTCSVQLDPNASHSSGIMIYKLVQVDVEMI